MALTAFARGPSTWGVTDVATHTSLVGAPCAAGASVCVAALFDDDGTRARRQVNTYASLDAKAVGSVPGTIRSVVATPSIDGLSLWVAGAGHGVALHDGAVLGDLFLLRMGP